MGKDLINPLQGLLKQASGALPARSGRTEAFARRLHHDGPSILIADVSESMTSPAWGGKRKIDVLRAAVGDIMSGAPVPHVIAFSSDVREGVTQLPEPAGGTALHLAIAAAARHRPGTTLVISDGQPDDEAKALAEAELLTGRIDTMYVGPDADKAAIDFMARLARLGCGSHSSADLTRAQPQLAVKMQQLLLPNRRG